MRFKIAVLPGDGIGDEFIPESDVREFGRHPFESGAVSSRRTLRKFLPQHEGIDFLLCLEWFLCSGNF